MFTGVISEGSIAFILNELCWSKCQCRQFIKGKTEPIGKLVVDPCFVKRGGSLIGIISFNNLWSEFF